MPTLSSDSLNKLNTCHPDLQKLIKEVIKYIDIKVICGHRSKEEQNKVYANGLSKKKYPQSKHNSFPSLAVDIAPYPINWDNLNRFYYIGGFVVATAISLGIKVRWGGDWNTDYEISDNKFNDLVHIELIDDTI